MSNNLFPIKTESKPMIYAYEEKNPNYKGLLKIGFTTIGVENRIKQQYPIQRPGGTPYKIVFAESAMYPDGGNFLDKDLHRYLDKHGYKNVGGEWYQCSVDDVKAAWIAIRTRTKNEERRINSFPMRPEQEQAVEKTFNYFNNYPKEDNKSPKFLWNAKMRFGKTFAAYELAKKMKFNRVLILTFKPAVQDAWETDLKTHIDFEGWQFVSREGLQYEDTDKNRPIVCFGSFQDYLGENKENGGIKPKNTWVHEIAWDLIIFDEYHFGAWRENAKKLFQDYDEENLECNDEDINVQIQMDESWLPISSRYYLYLSGTPFRAINSGEFIEEQIFNWTYSQEQKAKEDWVGPNNPYESLPRIVLMTYQVPQSIKKIAINTDNNEFDLNEFFAVEGKDENATFIHENDVQKWLDFIRGAYTLNEYENGKVNITKSYLPFYETKLLSILSHTLWYLPNVGSCYAMKKLLEQKQNNFYHTYKVILCAGKSVGNGIEALKPLQKEMDDPLNTKTITLTCGKLCTGVTVKPWSGIFMLRNLSSPETYFQAAFRVQSPWTIDVGGHEKEIIKKECYVFDFAIDRALKQISDYSTRLNVDNANIEEKVGEFINYLPVLAYQEGTMREINASQILDFAMSGTTATLLARKWESPTLINITTEMLKKILDNEKALEILMKIEGFRSINKDIETIINKTDEIKKKKKNIDYKPNEKQKKEDKKEEKNIRSKRKEIIEKLLKFITRIPVFMYLTDYREYTLQDVISKLEPSLFKKVTGLGVEDFNYLVNVGLFNKALLNDAVYKFKRYEDASLSYSGKNMHSENTIGLFDTTISKEEYEKMATNQEESLK